MHDKPTAKPSTHDLWLIVIGWYYASPAKNSDTLNAIIPPGMQLPSSVTAMLNAIDNENLQAFMEQLKMPVSEDDDRAAIRVIIDHLVDQVRVEALKTIASRLEFSECLSPSEYRAVVEAALQRLTELGVNGDIP